MSEIKLIGTKKKSVLAALNASKKIGYIKYDIYKLANNSYRVQSVKTPNFMSYDADFQYISSTTPKEVETKDILQLSSIVDQNKVCTTELISSHIEETVPFIEQKGADIIGCVERINALENDTLRGSELDGFRKTMKLNAELFNSLQQRIDTLEAYFK